MSQDQIIILFCLAAIATRIPRIVERWKAPLLRGPEWFFSVHVASAFWSREGATILRNYRWRLFIPWAIELPIDAAVLATGKDHTYILWVAVVVTLLTRLNYYAAHHGAEDRARRAPGSMPAETPAAVALSLQPRTLRDYTNPWIEAAIVLMIGGTAVSLAYRFTAGSDAHALRDLLNTTIFVVYLQLGLLLAKRAFVRARVLAPANDAEQYLAWRESFRRLCTTLCDYVRLGFAAMGPLIAIITALAPSQRREARSIVITTILAVSLIAAALEWRMRLRYLDVARRTRPANFLSMTDFSGAARIVCFRPSLPVLLLNSPNGYSLNLASSPAKVAYMYAGGYAVLWLLLTRLTA